MAGDGKAILSFDVTINCRNAVQWALDNRLSLCTDSSVLIMNLLYSPNQLESSPCFHFEKIQADKKAYNMLGLDGQQFLDLQEKAKTIDDKHELGLDKTLCPLLQTNVSTTGYRCVRWSPLGGDNLNRCVLGTLTHDHKLCIYTTGETLYTWKQVVCLSDVYSCQDNTSVSTIESVKVKANRLSAMELAWSSCYRGDDTLQCCLLCTGMRNGDLVLWKIKFPVLSIEDCEVLNVHRLTDNCPSSITWTEQWKTNTDCLIVGCTNGTLHMTAVNLQDGSIVSELCLYHDEDGMEITCLGTQVLSEDRIIVLAAKEAYLMSYVVTMDMSKNLRIQLKSNLSIETPLYITSMNLSSDSVTITTHDGKVLTGLLTTTQTDINVQLSPASLKHPPDGAPWSCQGGDTSANSMFLAVVMSRRSHCYTKHPIAKKPVKVHFIQLSNNLQDRVENLIQDHKVTFLEDLFEIFREHLWIGKNLTPSITDCIAQPHTWHSLPLRSLRVLRFFLMTIKLHIPTNQDTGEQSEELVIAERNIKNVTEMIIGKYVCLSLNKLLSQESEHTCMDQLIAGGMLNWMEVHMERFKDTPLLSCLDKVKQIVGQPTQLNCAVCGEKCELREEFDVHCKNGHCFSVCCQTLRLCDSPGYRVCVVCKAQAVTYRTRKEYTWLAEAAHLCTLCGGVIA